MTGGARRWSDDPVPHAVAAGVRDGAPTVAVAGELDLHGCERLVEAAVRSATPGVPLMIDIRTVTYPDSTGARALLPADRAARDRCAPAVRVIAAPGAPRRGSSG